MLAAAQISTVLPLSFIKPTDKIYPTEVTLAANVTKKLDGMDWTAPTFATKDELLQQMAQFDKEMEQALEKCDDTEEVDWFGQTKNINEHISSMQSHEMMHLGQIIAFCHVFGIDIPQDVAEAMHLTG